jgi:hypothetical protein
MDEPQQVAASAMADRGQKDYTIIVNTRQKVVHREELSYEEIVKLAFENTPTGPNVIISVSYTDAVGPKPDGTLAKGGHVRIKDGTVFNVTATDKS